MSSSFVLFQPLSLRKAASGWGSYGLGSGVAGLSVLTHMHTLPTILLFILSRRSSPLHDCAEGSHTSNFHVLPVVCSSTDKNGVVFPHTGPRLSIHSSRGLIVFPRTGFFLVLVSRTSYPRPLCKLIALMKEWNCKFVKEIEGGVCVWARTDSPTTPTPKQ